MNSFNLNIAGYIIRFESEEFELEPGRRFEKFCFTSDTPVPHPPTPQMGGCIPDEDSQTAIDYPTAPQGGKSFDSSYSSDTFKGKPGIIAPHLGGWGVIRVTRGAAELPSSAKCLFHAPYVEEREGIRTEKNPEFWSVWKQNGDLFIKTTFPLSEGNKKGLLKFSFTQNKWDLTIDSEKRTADPMEYPLDGLILYYLTVINSDIMIHASGVNHKGKGYVFSGISGKGKTTMTRLWSAAGATVIHDDRLIIRKTGNGFSMYNTPVYDNEEPSSSGIDAVFIIDHGKENISEQLNGAVAISSVMANCIQHNWGPEIISGLLGSVTALCSDVPVYKLTFRPDDKITDHIING